MTTIILAIFLAQASPQHSDAGVEPSKNPCAIPQVAAAEANVTLAQKVLWEALSPKTERIAKQLVKASLEELKEAMLSCKPKGLSAKSFPDDDIDPWDYEVILSKNTTPSISGHANISLPVSNYQYQIDLAAAAAVLGVPATPEAVNKAINDLVTKK